jgi:hypothetical protein
MPRPRTPVVMVIADHDKREFSVEGPMVDDTRWTNAVANAINRGQRVTCSTAEQSTKAAADDFISRGYSQVPSGTIVSLIR